MKEMFIERGYELSVNFTYYQGSSPIRSTCYPIAGQGLISEKSCQVQCICENRQDSLHGKLMVSFLEDVELPASVSLSLKISNWNKENYLLLPAAVYNGNRYHCIDVKYPPFVPTEFWSPSDTPVKITDIPRLSDCQNQSRIQLLSGDVSTPMISYYDPKQKAGCIFQTVHETPYGYNGLFVKEDLEAEAAEFSVCVPGVREEYYYRMTDTQVLSDDEGKWFKKGDHIELPFVLCYFACSSVSGLFEKVFQNRYALEPHAGSRCVVPFSQAFDSIEKRFESAYYDAEEGFYGLGSKNGRQFWQTGWVGGGIAGYPLLCKGNRNSQKHAESTLQFIFSKLQNQNGWLYPMYIDRQRYGDTLKYFLGETETEEDQNILLIRKNADALYFILRQIMYLQSREEKQVSEQVPEQVLVGTRKLCDAFQKLWESNGQLGQFINIATNEIVIGGSAAGAITGAALVLADQLFGGYLETAEEITKYYCDVYLDQGLLNGGPGEILQCPDSESSFGLLESCVELYLATGKEMWKQQAVKAAHYAASWVMSYDFNFPQSSTNARFGMRTTGTVFANAQNKHSAPGICTLSGASLLWLYRATRKPEFLQLLSEITRGVMQFVQTENRLFPTLADKNPTPGCVCERVQTSDWEGKDAVGEVLAPSSVWPEVSALLICAEIPSVYMDVKEHQLAVFDHLEASFSESSNKLTIDNPTQYEAGGEIWIENGEQQIRKYYFDVSAHSKIEIEISE